MSFMVALVRNVQCIWLLELKWEKRNLRRWHIDRDIYSFIETLVSLKEVTKNYDVLTFWNICRSINESGSRRT